jgi:hypothetical protein
MELRVSRDRIAVCEAVQTEPPGELAEDAALLRVDRFGLSANNVSYAAMGDELGYWRVFPAPAGWGLVPAWGYATVVDSRVEGVAVGDQVSGLVPMAEHLTVRPAVGRFGFADTASHRAELSRVYNQYLPAGDADDLQLIMRPLFGTAVLLDLALADAGDSGTVVLTSASSKTAYGLAHLLRRRDVPVAGLTSAGHVEWVRALGLYDPVLAYDDVAALPPATALVDFTGDHELLHRLHVQLAPTLRRSILVGFTRWHADRDGDPEPPGPQPAFFFAPDEMVRRGRELASAYVEAWPGFAPLAERATRIERVSGPERVAALWSSLVAGSADPAASYIASL